jgi:hypothetical protein
MVIWHLAANKLMVIWHLLTMLVGCCMLLTCGVSFYTKLIVMQHITSKFMVL